MLIELNSVWRVGNEETRPEQIKKSQLVHATTHLREKALQRLLEMSFRGTGLQRTIKQVVSSYPTSQLNNPQGIQRPQLAQPIQWHGTRRGLADGLHPDASFSRV